jgi:hypothetical protein
MKLSLSCNGSKSILNGIMCCGAFFLSPHVPHPHLPPMWITKKVYPHWVYRLTIVAMGQKTSYQMGEVQPNAWC